MKKHALLYFLFSFLLGYSQDNPQPNKANDWNSTRSNKTSKTSRVNNPDGNNPPSDIKKTRKSATIGKWTTISQDSKRKGRDATIEDYATIGLSYGISTPSSSFSNNAYAKNGNYFELAGVYYFSKFGIGVSIGQITSPTNKNFSSSINSADIPTTNTTQNWKQFYYGIGPEYKAQFGDFSAIFSTKIGLQSVKSTNLESNYANEDTPITIFKIKSDKNSSLSYFSAGLKFGYNLNSNLSLFATANYMTAFSNEIIISESKIADINDNGIIDTEDLEFAIGSGIIDYEISTQNVKPQTTNFGIGLSYNFGNNSTTSNEKRKKSGRTAYSNITLERSQDKDSVNDKNNTERRGKRKAKKECLKSGGSFWESGDGSYSCMKPLPFSTAKTSVNTSNELFRSKKRKCFKAGGQWVTNSHGSFCLNIKKENAKVEVRGWNPEEKSTSNKGYDYYKAKNYKLDEDSDGDGLSDNLEAEEANRKLRTKVKSTKKTARTGRNPQTGATIKIANKAANIGSIDNDTIATKRTDLKKLADELGEVIVHKSKGPDDKLDEDSEGDGLLDGLEIFKNTDNDCNDDDRDSTPLKRMNKAELIDAMAKDANLSKADAKKALETLTSNLSKSLENGSYILLYDGDLPGQNNSSEAPGDSIPDMDITIEQDNPSRKINNLVEDSDGDGILDSNARTGHSRSKRKLRIKRRSKTTSINNDDYDGFPIKRMNKAELIDALSKDANLSKADAGKALNAFIAILSKELNNENCVKLIVPVVISEGGAKDEIDVDTLTKITANETKTIIKFRIAEDEKRSHIVLIGTLREYEEADTETGAVEVIPFEITGTIKGNYKDGNTAAMLPGDPIPGMDITVEQCCPGISSSSYTTNSDGDFTINIDNPTAGLYTIVINGESSKEGFVISNFDTN